MPSPKKYRHHPVVVVVVFRATHPSPQKQRLRPFQSGGYKWKKIIVEEEDEEEKRTLPVRENQRRRQMHVSRVGVRFSAPFETQHDLLRRDEGGGYVTKRGV